MGDFGVKAQRSHEARAIIRDRRTEMNRILYGRGNYRNYKVEEQRELFEKFEGEKKKVTIYSVFYLINFQNQLKYTRVYCNLEK